jgi:hypothetical protein
MLRMANGSVNADGNVEGMRIAARTRRLASGGGHGRPVRAAPLPPPAANFFDRRRRRVGLSIGGLYYRPRPFSVYYHHDRRRTRFFSVVCHSLHCPSFVCHCRRICCRAVCPAPRILGGPGARRVSRGRLRCAGGRPRHCHRHDGCGICLYRWSCGIDCMDLVKESVVALPKRKWLMWLS